MAKLKKEKKPQNPGKETMTLFLQYSVVLLCVLIVTILPLAMKDGFYKIGEFKFQVYKVLMIGGMVFIIPELILYAIFTRKEFKLKESIKSLSVTDWFVIAYMISTLISFFANPKYMKDNFWGYPGWYMGLFSQFTFVFLYFVISRFGDYYKIILAFLAGTSFITYVFGILNRLLIDPLGVYEGIDPYYYTFLSTLGQNSWYSSFVCTFLPFAMGLYLLCEKKWLRVMSGIFCMFGFTTLVSQNTDSAYFAMVGAFLVLLYPASKSAKGMRRLMELGIGLLLGGKVTWLLLKVHPNEYLDGQIDEITRFLIFDSKVWILVCLAALVWALFLVLEKKNVDVSKPCGALRWIVYIATVLFVAAVAYILWAGVHGKFSDEVYEKVTQIPYLKWYNEWGNGRGFTWTVTWKMITEFSPAKFLAGVGPDGYARYGYEFYQDLIRTKWGDNVLTNAHNEWLNMFVDGGIISAVSYLGIFLSQIICGVREKKNAYWITGIAACVASYMFHNLFCYQQVCCTPFIFMLLAVGAKERAENIR